MGCVVYDLGVREIGVVYDCNAIPHNIYCSAHVLQ